VKKTFEKITQIHLLTESKTKNTFFNLIQLKSNTIQIYAAIHLETFDK